MKRNRFVLFAVLAVMNLVVALSIIPQVSAQTSGGCTQYHTVQPGETLYRIAARYGNTVAHIAAFNGISNPARIFAGQRLCVWDNSLNPVPQPGDSTYTVQRGDTLYSIARRFNIPLYTLASFNGIWDVSRIYAGQVLRIPSSPAPVPPLPAPSVNRLSIIESNNVHFANGAYWISDANGFFPNVSAANATGVAFYLQDGSGNISLLGDDRFGVDGWGVAASIPENPFWGSIYAIAYNDRAQVAQSNVITVRH